jgi:hypothetical protein
MPSAGTVWDGVAGIHISERVPHSINQGAELTSQFGMPFLFRSINGAVGEVQVSLAMFSEDPAGNRDRLETGEDKQISVPDYDARYLSA